MDDGLHFNQEENLFYLPLKQNANLCKSQQLLIFILLYTIVWNGKISA